MKCSRKSDWCRIISANRPLFEYIGVSGGRETKNICSLLVEGDFRVLISQFFAYLDCALPCLSLAKVIQYKQMQSLLSVELGLLWQQEVFHGFDERVQIPFVEVRVQFQS